MLRSIRIGILSGFVTLTAAAGGLDDRILNSGTDLRDWCKEASEAALVSRGLSPSNWTASYSDQVNMLMVKGQWRVEGANYAVQCSAARGTQARFANVSIQDPT